jgi:hypothetical protein
LLTAERYPPAELIDSALPVRATDRRRLRIGLIVDSLLAPPYLLDFAFWGQSQDELCISHLIVQRAPSAPGGRYLRALGLLRRFGPRELWRRAAFHALMKLETLAFSFTRDGSEQLEHFDLARVVRGLIEVHPVVSASGRSYRYTEGDLQTIRQLELDLLIRCTPAILRGGILTVTRFGVLSCHQGDNRRHRGELAGFWEVCRRQPTSGFFIQRLTEELYGGHVLLRGSIRTRIPYVLNQATLLSKSFVHLKRLLKDIARSQALPTAEDPRIHFSSVCPAPPLHRQTAYALMCLSRPLLAALNRFVLSRHEHWGVAFMRGDWKSAVLSRAIRIQPLPNHFIADPFVIREQGEDYCFVEDFDCRKGRACISAYRLSGQQPERLGEAIVEPFHMSYPYLFRFAGKLYMCPETSEQRQIRLYECVRFPLQWQLAKVLMSDVSAADSMLFEHGGRWWLLTNMDPQHRRDHSSELHVFYSDSPLSDDWVAHACNPVYIDADRARNGGIVLNDSEIYRMSQIPGFRIYGQGLAVNRIALLSTTQFKEERLYEILPQFFKRLRGTHHFHSTGDLCVFDFSYLATCSRFSRVVGRITRAGERIGIQDRREVGPLRPGRNTADRAGARPDALAAEVVRPERM